MAAPEPVIWSLLSLDNSRCIQSNVSDSLKLSIIQIYAGHGLDHDVLQLIRDYCKASLSHVLKLKFSSTCMESPRAHGHAHHKNKRQVARSTGVVVASLIEGSLIYGTLDSIMFQVA
jgi:hypothetical protein